MAPVRTHLLVERRDRSQREPVDHHYSEVSTVQWFRERLLDQEAHVASGASVDLYR